jgi:hypothetical protein
MVHRARVDVKAACVKSGAERVCLACRRLMRRVKKTSDSAGEHAIVLSPYVAVTIIFVRNESQEESSWKQRILTQP